MQLEEFDKAKSSRGSFIRRVGMLLAAGVGAAIMRPGEARADLGRCCPTNSCTGISCGPGQTKFFCDCGPTNYCECGFASGCYPAAC
jgi:hypothetical protein